MAWVVSPALAAWMAPVVLGMAISIPLVALTSARAPGQWLRRHRLLCTPEETTPPQILRRARRLRAQLED